MKNDLSVEQYLSLSKTEQIKAIESILEEMWDEGLVELVGFDQFNEPLFSAKKHG